MDTPKWHGEVNYKTIDAQITGMRHLFKLHHESKLADHNLFKPILNYVEGAWENDAMQDDQFEVQIYKFFFFLFISNLPSYTFLN